MNVYHVVRPEDWDNFDSSDYYSTESLSTEGFIHCSFSDQIDGVIERYFSDADSVVILTIDPELLASRINNEPSTNDEIFPHIYGKINKEAVIETEMRKIN